MVNRFFSWRCSVLFPLLALLPSAHGVVTLTWTQTPTHLLCGDIPANQKFVLSASGTGTAPTVQIVVTGSSGTAPQNFTITVAAGATATIAPVLLAGTPVFQWSPPGVMSGVDTTVQVEVFCTVNCAGNIMPAPIVLTNFGLGGEAYSETRAPCIFVAEEFYLGGGVSQESGMLTLQPWIVGGEDLQAWTGLQGEWILWSCPTSEFCVSASVTACESLSCANECIEVHRQDWVLDPGCTEFSNDSGIQSCGEVCSTDIDIVYPAQAGYNFVEVNVVDIYGDGAACCGNTFLVTGTATGCRCPNSVASLSQPEGYIFGPYYRVPTAGEQPIVPVDPEEIVDLINTFDGEGLSTDVDDELRSSPIGSRILEFKDALLEASWSSTPYPVLSLPYEGPIPPITVDFGALTAFEAQTWRSFARNIITGVIVLKLVFSAFLWLAWAFGATTIDQAIALWKG